MRAKLGSIYQRTKKQPDGTVRTLPIWWIKYRKDGQVFRESSGSEKHADAERLLRRRLGEIVTGKFAGLRPERVLMAELFEDVAEDYRDCERRTLDDLNTRLKNHLIPFFGEIRAADLTTSHQELSCSAALGRGSERDD